MSRLPNLPTILTWLRIVLIPLVLGVYYLPWPEHQQNLWACAFFVVSAATDWFDGYLARRWGQTSVFGAWLDTLADKLLVAACMVVLLHLKRIDMLVALIIIGREITISALREWMAKIGASGSVAVALIGKWKTAVQLGAIGFLLYFDDVFGLPVFSIGTALAWVAAALTLWSMVYYLAKAWPAIRAKQTP
jgi:CDP-diacylglycerol--glycerol-3-phosphate 3-phosphatidyltransferase/cardiolipin synthase